MNFETYLNKTYSAWLGKMIGIRLGAPVEGWTAQQIQETYGDIKDYIVDYSIFAADDDSNGPLFFVRSLLQNPSIDITPEEMGECILNYLSKGHGFFWWGGDGVATEHTAYLRLLEGIDAPLSGSYKTNGIELAEQIGGQIFSDCWGYVSAGNPEVAKILASKMSSVTHDKAGIDGGIYVAVMIALAYELKDCKDIIIKALSYIDQESSYYKLVQEILNLYETRMSKEDCLSYIQSYHGYDKYPGICHIMPNTAIMIWAMLYGENDFDTTMTILCTAGWDTDCTCGNVGSIMGLIAGIENISKKWIKPINDLILSSSILGSFNIDTISSTTLLYCFIGSKLNHIDIPKKYLRYVEKEYHTSFFDLPYGTQAFCTNANRYSETNLLQQNGRLKCIINQGFPNYIGKVYQKTYYTPDDVYDCRYQPSFSPILYPNATVLFTISNPKELDLSFHIYVKTIDGKEWLSEPFIMKKEETEYLYQIDCPNDSLIVEYGIQYKYPVRFMHEYFYIHQVKTSRKARFSIDFKKQGMEDWGLDFGGLSFQEVRQCTTYQSQSYCDLEGLHIEDDMVLFSDSLGKLKTLKIQGKLMKGESIEICFDIQGYRNYKSIEVKKETISHLIIQGKQCLIDTYDLKDVKYNDILSLQIERKNDLIKVKLWDEVFHYPITDNLLQYGACGIKVSKNTSCVIYGCELELI